MLAGDEAKRTPSTSDPAALSASSNKDAYRFEYQQLLARPLADMILATDPCNLKPWISFFLHGNSRFEIIFVSASIGQVLTRNRY